MSTIKKQINSAEKSALEDNYFFQFKMLSKEHGIEKIPVRQFIIPEGKRKFAFDFGWPEYRLLIEIQGGIFMRHGGHNTPSGLIRDYEKCNYAIYYNYRTLYFTGAQIDSLYAINTTVQIIRRIKSGEIKI
jgi:hypothetical protein